MTENTPASYKWLSVLAILAIIWNLIGVAMVFLNANVAPETLSTAGYNTAQIDYIMGTPVWAKFANGFAVLTGLVGSVALLLRRKIAYSLFAISLFAIMAVMVDAFLRGGFKVLNGPANGLSIAVVVIAIFLFWTTHVAKTSGALK